MKLKGKSAIITGAGRDIGRACALALAAEGANVAINYFSSSDGADSAVKEINDAGGKAFALPMIRHSCDRSQALHFHALMTWCSTAVK